MFFSLIDRVPPQSEGRILIAEYVRIRPQTEIPTFVNAAAEFYISSGLEGSGRYTLRCAGRAISGDLRTVALLWEAQSGATAVEVAQAARAKVDPEAIALVDGIDVKFMKPTSYDARRGDLSKGRRSNGSINVFLTKDDRSYEPDGDIPCALHDEIVLAKGGLENFREAAADLLAAFETKTGWVFSGAGEDLERPDRLMHFWRMVGIGTIPPAMTALSDIPEYAKIQDKIVTELQNLYMAARRDLPIGSVKGDPA